MTDQKDGILGRLEVRLSGACDLSGRAIGNIRALSEEHLSGRDSLVLIKEAPLPKRMLVGDLSDTPRVLAALGIHPLPPHASRTAGE